MDNGGDVRCPFHVKVFNITNNIINDTNTLKKENLEAENCPVEEMIQKEIQRQVRKAVAGLEEKYRIPVYLFYTVQMSVAEISKTLKIPEGTVKTRLYKARKLLKEKLEVVLDET